MAAVKKCVMSECKYYQEYGECSSFCEYYRIKPVLTRYDRILNMSVDEIAGVIQRFCRSMESCYQCPLEENCAESDNIGDIKCWLEQPMED